MMMMCDIIRFDPTSGLVLVAFRYRAQTVSVLLLTPRDFGLSKWIDVPSLLPT